MQVFPTTCWHVAPGGATVIVGENELAPLGPTAFSVGEAAGADVGDSDCDGGT